MNARQTMATLALLFVSSILHGQQSSNQAAPAAPARVFIVVFDFTGPDELGPRLADSVRLGLAPYKQQFEVIDQLTTQESSKPFGFEADIKEVGQLMREQFAASIGVFGTVTKTGDKLEAKVRFVNLLPSAPEPVESETFSDDTERARAIIAGRIIEKITGQARWKPPEMGDQTEPKAFGKPENTNGDFESGHRGWDRPEGVSTFLEKGPACRGTILRMKNDLARDPWLEYRRDLLLKNRTPDNPPQIAHDTSYGSVAGLEGTDYTSEFFKCTPGQRYWLIADGKGPCAAKIFIKGWKRTEHAQDGLSESALKELGLTPEQFAAMSPERRKQLIEQDLAKNPMRYLRECWRWQLSTKGSNEWTHYAAPFPPRGGMPKDVEFLHIKILTYWPPGENLWDNVNVYKDPNQTAPTEESKARTPNFGKTSDKVPQQ